MNFVLRPTGGPFILGLVWLAMLGTSTGCQIPQSPECKAYVDCQVHYDEVNGLPSLGLEEIYGEEGQCWRDDQSATSCTSSCTASIERLREGLIASGDDVGDCA